MYWCLQKWKKKQEEAEKKAQDELAKLELLRKKIKFTLIKPEVFKNKRENIGGFIPVEPNQIEKAIITETEEIPIKVEGEENKEEGEENKEEGEEKKEEGEENKVEGEENKVEEEEKKEEGEEKKEENKEGENVPQQPLSKK